MFEQKLKNENRNQHNITYDISQLHRFIDLLDDLVCLVYVIPPRPLHFITKALKL
jgi:hypothetical protein